MTFTPEEGAQIFERDTMGRVRLPWAGGKSCSMSMNAAG